MPERIPTNLRTLKILEALGEHGRPMTPTEIGHQIDLPKQTTHRLCGTLVEQGYLVKETNGKRLRPARKTRQIATDILHGGHTHIGRHQILLRVADQIKETVNFVVPVSDGMTYLDRVETRWPFQVQLPIGTHVPFHCTASGKTFLASLPSGNRRKLVEALNLHWHTSNTLIDPASLLKELKQVAKQGYALDNEEFVDGMVAIAVPIKDDRGKYIASIAFHGPVQRLSLDFVISQKDVLVQAANDLSAVLTH